MRDFAIACAQIATHSLPSFPVESSSTLRVTARSALRSSRVKVKTSVDVLTDAGGPVHPHIAIVAANPATAHGANEAFGGICSKVHGGREALRNVSTHTIGGSCVVVRGGTRAACNIRGWFRWATPRVEIRGF